jgi:antitoxin ParD1/3/4
MIIQLSLEAEARIRKLIERGGYDGPEAVVDEALQILAERDQYAQLKAAIAVGMEQIKRGEVIPWTPDSLDRLKQEAEELVRLGTPFKPEVIP